jgi:hypothetical protein
MANALKSIRQDMQQETTDDSSAARVIVLTRPPAR